ncbi:MAG: hypothetical protein J6F30_05920 [Cellulosilyticum sp.]|nr:hypothetical protein [Cellulosilyticum sp.]
MRNQSILNMKNNNFKDSILVKVISSVTMVILIISTLIASISYNKCFKVIT